MKKRIASLLLTALLLVAMLPTTAQAAANAASNNAQTPKNAAKAHRTRSDRKRVLFFISHAPPFRGPCPFPGRKEARPLKSTAFGIRRA